MIEPIDVFLSGNYIFLASRASHNNSVYVDLPHLSRPSRTMNKPLLLFFIYFFLNNIGGIMSFFIVLILINTLLKILLNCYKN